MSPLQNPTASMTAPTARIPATSDRGSQSGFCKSAHTIQWVVCAFAYNYPLQNWNKCAILNKWIFPAADAGKRTGSVLRSAGTENQEENCNGYGNEYGYY